jgi:hypothetical protein
MTATTPYTKNLTVPDAINGYDLSGTVWRGGGGGELEEALIGAAAYYRSLHGWGWLGRLGKYLAGGAVYDYHYFINSVKRVPHEALGCLKAVYNPRALLEGYVRGETLKYLKGTRYVGRLAARALEYDWIVDVGLCAAGSLQR